MSNIFHKNITITDGIHSPIAYEYADAAARLAATGFIPADVGKFAHQLDTDYVYMLTDDAPITWQPVTSLGVDPNAIHGNTAGEIIAITEKVVPIDADVLLIEDTADSNNKKRIQIGNLPDTAPTGAAGGDLGGTYPNPTVDDGADGTAIHDDTAGEINAISEKTSFVDNDIIVIEDSADSYNKKKVKKSNLGISSTTYPEFHFYASSYDNPNNADWTVNALASIGVDSTNNALITRNFDDTTEEGCGFTLRLPSGATGIIFNFMSRAATAPGTSKSVMPRLYKRTFVHNMAIGSWIGYDLGAITIPTNANYQSTQIVTTLSTLGLTANSVTQFELTRDPADVADDLVGDWMLLHMRITFT